MEAKRAKSVPNQIHNYDVKQMAGQGQFGKVYKAIDKRNMKTVAIKVIPLTKIKRNCQLKSLLKNQVEILSTLKHPNIIQFENLFANDRSINMVYEYCDGGSLEDCLPISQAYALQVFSQILSACSFAEKNNILHRDLKPANILLKKQVIKVADWGFSRILEEQVTAKSFVGSPAYMSPQLLEGGEYTHKADVWSFGVMLYECLFGEMPWSSNSIKTLLKKMKSVALRFPRNVPYILQKIILKSLEVNADKRATFAQLEKILLSTDEKACQNPEQSSQSVVQLSNDEIRKCSFYLEFAKKANEFADEEASKLCLFLILQNLQSLKLRVFQKQENHTKSSKKREKSSPAEDTQGLLQKEIMLISKMLKGSFQDNKQAQSRSVARSIMRKVVKYISEIQEQGKKWDENRGHLIEMNCLLDVIMFDELAEEAKDKQLSDRMEEMEQFRTSKLLRLLSHKIVHINQLYCRK